MSIGERSTARDAFDFNSVALAFAKRKRLVVEHVAVRSITTARFNFAFQAMHRGGGPAHTPEKEFGRGESEMSAINLDST